MTDDNPLAGGYAAQAGNFGAMSPQMQAAYLRLLAGREKQRFTPAPSWSGALAGVVQGINEGLEERKIDQALSGSMANAPPNTAPKLPPDFSDGSPATTAAPPQTHDGTAYSDRGESAPLLVMIASHEIGPKDKAALEAGGKVFPYPDGRQTSIGFGTRAQPGDENGIDKDEAGRRLQSEVSAASTQVHQFAPNAPYGWHKALTDLTFNTGTKWQGSGLGAAVKAGDWDKAKEIYPQYNKAVGSEGKLVEMAGLTKRRQDFLKEVDRKFEAAPGMPPGASVQAGGAPPAPGSQPPVQVAQAAPAAPGGVLPPMPGAREQFTRDIARVNDLKRYPIGTPEHAEGVRLEAELQKRTEQSAYTDPNTGQPYYGNDVSGRRPAPGMPRTPTPAELKGLEETASELAKARTVPVAEAIKAGPAAQKSLAALNTLNVIGGMPGSENMHTGPFAQHWLHAKQALQDLTGIPFEGVAPAEGIEKMNAYLGMAAAKELTNRPTQFDFSTFLKNNPGIQMSPEGRKMLTDILQQTARQDIAIAKLASKVKDPSDWAEIQDKYYQEHPIAVHYKGQEIKSAESLEAPKAAPGPAAVSEPSKRLRYNPATGKIE